MKTSILITFALATSTFAWPKPQLLGLDLNAGVTLFVTVTVTKPASTCLPASATGRVIGQPNPKPSSAAPSVPPAATVAPGQQSTSKLLPQPQTKPTPVSVVKSTSTLQPIIVSTSKPLSVVQPSWKPQPTPSTNPISKPQIPGRITGTAQASLSVGAAYQAAILFHHNTARANHGALPVTWDASCEANARLAANKCNYAHYVPAGVAQGQNIYATSGVAFNVTAAITETWYKKEFSVMLSLFGIANIPNTILPTVGHLTQVVWKETTKVGCASVDCGDNMKVGGAPSNLNKYTVCNYASAGNYGGQFAVNVGRPISTTNLGIWTD